jgi:hypothetical protein
MNDTSSEIAERVQGELMALSNATRFVMGAKMFDAARQMIIASLPKDLSTLELKRRLYERIYGKTLPF